MELRDKDLFDVARLARLRLRPEELESVRNDLNRVLGYVDKLSELDLTQVEPTRHVLKGTTPLRSDLPRPSLAVDDAVKNGPLVVDQMFQVPRIMEGGRDSG